MERAWLAQAESRARVLEESDQLKTAILSSVSHELRTPLTAIRLLIDTLRVGNGTDPEQQARQLDMINAQVDVLTQLAQEMYDLSLIESGQAGELAYTYQINAMNGPVDFFRNPFALGADYLTNFTNSTFGRTKSASFPRFIQVGARLRF